MDCAAKAYEGFESFIFICYAHDDAHLVYPIIERMVMDGYRVWYDDGIHVGEDWTDKVASRLDASSIVLAMLSENSVESIHCRNEISYSLSARKNLIGIKLSDFEMPGWLRLQFGSTIYLERTRYGETEFYERLSESHDMGSCRNANRRISDEELIFWREKWSGTTPIRRTKTESNRFIPIESSTASTPSSYAPSLSAQTNKKKTRKKGPLFLIASTVVLLAALLIFFLPRLRIGAAEEMSQPSVFLTTVSEPQDNAAPTPTLSLPEAEFTDDAIPSPNEATPMDDATPVYTEEALLAMAQEAEKNSRNYSMVSTTKVALEFPYPEDYLDEPREMTIKFSESGAIIIMPKPKAGNGALGTITAGTKVSVIAEYGGFYFFVAEDGRMGWNSKNFFTE